MGSQFYPQLARAIALYTFGISSLPQVILATGVSNQEDQSFLSNVGTPSLLD